MANTDWMSNLNAHVQLLQIRDKVKRLRKKSKRSSRTIARASGQAHPRGSDKGSAIGRGSSVVPATTRFKSIVPSQKMEKEKKQIKWWVEDIEIDIEESMMESNYWINRELRCKK